MEHAPRVSTTIAQPIRPGQPRWVDRRGIVTHLIHRASPREPPLPPGGNPGCEPSLSAPGVEFGPGGTNSLRLVLIAAGVACLGACSQASPGPIVPTAPPSPDPATATAFLPRGFLGLPSAPAATEPAAPAGPIASTAPATGTLDLAAAADRLNLLRAGDGHGPLLRVRPLDRIAQTRAEALAASGLLRHASDGQGTDVATELMSQGFSGQVAEVVLSVDADGHDRLGLVLQALLTDSANRGVVLDPAYRRLGLGAARDATSWYIVGLLAQEGPTE